MKISDLQINGITDPIGYTYHYICCSWKVTETSSTKQTAAKIQVSDTADFEHIIAEKSGAHLKQSGECLEIDLKPRTIYYYRIFITGDEGDEAVSPTGTFETGKMKEPFAAEWISPKAEDTFHPVIRKEFQVNRPVRKARLYMTGVGLFEVSLNGEKLGSEYLMPYVSDYEQKIQVITFSIDEYLTDSNSLEITLAKGWYMGLFGLELQKEIYGNRMAVIGELHIEYQDGTKECIGTDSSFTYQGTDTEDSGIYDGEIINRMLWAGKENPIKSVEVLKDPGREPGTKNLVKEHLTDRISLPILAKEEVAVKEIIKTPAGETVLDMGQNFAGFIEFTADFPKGTKITLDFGEILQEGNFFRGNYRDAKSQFIYVSGGRKERVHPHFTYFGFRYVKITGWTGEVKKEDFTGKVLYSDVSRIGYLETADAKINRLYENTLWGLKSNFMDIPTDCPQRSERLGWTGDAQVFAPTASYHMDTRAFFHKFMNDLREEQKILDGGVPNYLPNIGHKNDVGAVWGDIATLLPNTVYQFYGSSEELKNSYPLMKDWVDYIDALDKARGRTYLYDFDHTFGDWLALDGATPNSFKGSTDDTYIASVYYCHSIGIVSSAAERLNKVEDAGYYANLEEKVRQAIFKEFFTPSGRLAIDTQAAYVIALKFGIYMDREKIIAQFQKRLQKDCYQIKCGFVGAPLLCMVLAEAGLFELAYDFLLKEDFPSWLYSVKLGATTIWERWNSVLPDGTISGTGMNSLNHYAYGSVMEFVYAYAAGIRAAEPGFQKAVIEPHPDIRIPYMKMKYDSANGTYVCHWSIETDGSFQMHIEIPFNCSALVRLPGYTMEEMELPAGSYDYAYQPKQDFRKPYHKGTTLGRAAKDEKAMKILGKYTPAIAGIAASKDPEMASNTLEQISQMEYLPFDPEQFKLAMEEIGGIIQ